MKKQIKPGMLCIVGYYKFPPFNSGKIVKTIKILTTSQKQLIGLQTKNVLWEIDTDLSWVDTFGMLVRLKVAPEVVLIPISDPDIDVTETESLELGLIV
jgi:hypothetical protein